MWYLCSVRSCVNLGHTSGDRLQEVLLLQLLAKVTPTPVMETPDVSLRYCISCSVFYPVLNPPSDSNLVVVLCALLNYSITSVAVH